MLPKAVVKVLTVTWGDIGLETVMKVHPKYTKPGVISSTRIYMVSVSELTSICGKVTRTILEYVEKRIKKFRASLRIFAKIDEEFE